MTRLGISSRASADRINCCATESPKPAPACQLSPPFRSKPCRLARAPRAAPHNLEAEQALLGAILFDNETYNRITLACCRNSISSIQCTGAFSPLARK